MVNGDRVDVMFSCILRGGETEPYRESEGQPSAGLRYLTGIIRTSHKPIATATATNCAPAGPSTS